MFVGMSNFTLDISNSKHESERKGAVADLMNVIKECQTKYGSKTELATENDPRIVQLCQTWEKVLSHGLKSTASILQNVTDLVSGSNSDTTAFWDFASKHLTTHEKERFSTLRHVWTNCGKGRALIRAVLNERALERYILVWLNDNNILETSFEPWAIMRDEEFASLLPSMAAGLSSILFAIAIDTPELNVATRNQNEVRFEPRVATHPPQAPARKINAVIRPIITFEEISPAITPPSSFISSSEITKSANIDIIKEYTDIYNSKEAYSVDDALNSLQKNETKISQIENNPKSSVDSSALEVSEDSVISGYSQDYSATASSSTSSSHSNTSAVNEEALKKKLLLQEERCTLLEARVAELSLENHRLRILSRSSRHPLTYFTISIPKVMLQKSGSKEYFSYEIHIIPTQGGDEWSLYRRYNDFYKLHRNLEKENPSVKTLDFPPKKKLGNMNPEFVEQRRQRLQVYLKHLLSILPEVSSCNTRSQLERVFPFLCENKRD